MQTKPRCQITRCSVSFLGLPQVRATPYELRGRDDFQLTVESTVAATVCPDCQTVSFSLHEMSKPQLIRDLSLWQRRGWLQYAPRRFKCVRFQTPLSNAYCGVKRI